MNEEKIREILGLITNISILNISKIQASPEVYRIESPSETFALKVFPSHDFSAVRSQKFYQLAQDSNIPVPQLEAVSTEGDSEEWILLQWVEGKVLHKLAGREVRQKAAVRTGELLRKIHTVKLTSFGWPTSAHTWVSDDPLFSYDFFAHRIENFIEKGLSRELRDRVYAHLQGESIGVIKEFSNPVLLRGDLTGGNVIVGSQGEITIFDPGEIIAGDPMSDLAYTQTSQCSPEFRRGVLKGYFSQGSLSDDESERFRLWLLIRQTVITYRQIHLQGGREARHSKYLAELLKGNFSFQA